jgi:hypothetical protein
MKPAPPVIRTLCIGVPCCLTLGDACLDAPSLPRKSSDNRSDLGRQ